MTTIRQIITDAFREGGLVQVGLTPDADEFDEGLRKLQNFITSVFGAELGENLASVTYGINGVSNRYGKYVDATSVIDGHYVPANTRLVSNLSQTKTVYLAPDPQDGARFAVVDNAGNFATYNMIVNGNGRKIESATTVTLNTNSVSKQWFYRADLGEWVLIDTLTANSQSPFPTEFDEFLVLTLAMRLNPRFQSQTAPETIEAYRRIKKLFRARYSQSKEMRSEEGLLRVGATNYATTEDFETGTTI